MTSATLLGGVETTTKSICLSLLAKAFAPLLSQATSSVELSVSEIKTW